MIAVLLAGGTGSRLAPLCKLNNKHTLPIYDKQMICYPLQTIKDCGIKDVMLVSGPEHSGQFIDLLGDGSEYGLNIFYGCQMKAGGIAEALKVAKPFARNNNMLVLLGDNIFQESLKDHMNIFNEESLKFGHHAHVICKPVDEPQHYGVLTDDGNNIEIIEKPTEPKSNLAVTGAYFYTSNVFHEIDKLQYSKRGELEVTDLNNSFAKQHNLSYSILKEGWIDCGVSIDHLYECSNIVKGWKTK